MAILEGVLCHECLNYIEAKGKLEDILHFKGIIILRHSIVDECRKQKRELKLSRWVCSWQEDDKIVTKYLESCAKMSKPKAPTAD